VFLFLSKLLPPLVYPLGLACLALAVALICRGRRGQATLIIFSIVLLWLGGNRLISMAIVRSLEAGYLPLTSIPRAPVIVVLGGGSRSPDFPRPTAEINEAGDRLLYAAWLYKQGAAPHLLLSGGRAAWLGSGRVDEAEVMAQVLEMMGVPRAALWLEDGSRNTYENADATRRLLAERGISEIILVTSATHMPRSVRLFERQGLRVIPAPTDFQVTQADWNYFTQPDLGTLREALNLLPDAEALAYTSRALKEYIGMIVYALRGW
jgi:uncharacterized SAM-binding protein YcdF (DUF218 family)